MPRARRPEYDSDEFASRYLSGEPLNSLAEWLNVTPPAVLKAAYLRGFKCRSLGSRY